MAIESKVIGKISAMLVVIMIINNNTVMSHHHSELSQAPQSQPEEDKDQTNMVDWDLKVTVDEKYYQSLPGEFKEYISQCTKQISRQCGEEIFGSILSKTKVSTICCHDLVDMGFECHNALVRVMAGSPKYKHMAVQIIGKSRRVFDHCVDVDN